MTDKDNENNKTRGDSKSPPHCSDHHLSGYDADVETTPEGAAPRRCSPVTARWCSDASPPQARRRRRCRTLFTDTDLQQMEDAFLADPYPDILQREALADLLGVTEDRIQVWFQNRRSKRKRHLLGGGSSLPAESSYHGGADKLRPVCRPNSQVSPGNDPTLRCLRQPIWTATDAALVNTCYPPYGLWTVPGHVPWRRPYGLTAPAVPVPTPYSPVNFTTSNPIYLGGQALFRSAISPSPLTARLPPFCTYQCDSLTDPYSRSWSVQSGTKLMTPTRQEVHQRTSSSVGDAYISTSPSETSTPEQDRDNSSKRRSQPADPIHREVSRKFKPKRPWEDHPSVSSILSNEQSVLNMP